MGENAYCKQQVSACNKKRTKTIAKNKAKNHLGPRRADTSIALHVGVPTRTLGYGGGHKTALGHRELSASSSYVRWSRAYVS